MALKGHLYAGGLVGQLAVLEGGTTGQIPVMGASAPAWTTVSSWSAVATTAQYWSNSSGKLLTTDQVWGAGAEVALTDAATIAVDLSTGINFAVTLTDNRTIGNPTNTKAGQSGRIRVAQDGTGSRTLAFGSNYVAAGGTSTLVLSTAASTVDYLYYDVRSSTEIFLSLNADVKH